MSNIYLVRQNCISTEGCEIESFDEFEGTEKEATEICRLESSEYYAWCRFKDGDIIDYHDFS